MWDVVSCPESVWKYNFFIGDQNRNAGRTSSLRIREKRRCSPKRGNETWCEDRSSGCVFYYTCLRAYGLAGFRAFMSLQVYMFMCLRVYASDLSLWCRIVGFLTRLLSLICLFFLPALPPHLLSLHAFGVPAQDDDMVCRRWGLSFIFKGTSGVSARIPPSFLSH